MQPDRFAFSISTWRFQSSPVPEDGCNAIAYATPVSCTGFQSSPVPEDGCNTHTAKPKRRLCRFNPHPSRRTGATLGKHPHFGNAISFNPHPSRRTGATLKAADLAAASGERVSILTRPGGRVQRSRRPSIRRSASFQSSPVLEDGCNEYDPYTRRAASPVSILTRPGGRVQRG